MLSPCITYHIVALKCVFFVFQNMKLGVFDVIPRGSLDTLTAEDLRLLLNGMGDISTQALIGYTSFNDESSTCILDRFLSPLVFYTRILSKMWIAGFGFQFWL